MDAINEYKGSASFKVIAHVKEKGKEPIGSIIGIMCQDNNNSVERREDSGDRASINSSESRDGRGDLSALTEPPKLSLKIPAASSRRKSLFGFFKRKRIGAGAVAGDSSLKTDEASIISSTVLHGQDGTGKDIVALSSSTPRIVHFNDDYGGIGASSNLPCLSGDEHELWTITRIVK